MVARDTKAPEYQGTEEQKRNLTLVISEYVPQMASLQDLVCCLESRIKEEMESRFSAEKVVVSSERRISRARRQLELRWRADLQSADLGRAITDFDVFGRRDIQRFILRKFSCEYTWYPDEVELIRGEIQSRGLELVGQESMSSMAYAHLVLRIERAICMWFSDGLVKILDTRGEAPSRYDTIAPEIKEILDRVRNSECLPAKEPMAEYPPELTLAVESKEDRPITSIVRLLSPPDEDLLVFIRCHPLLGLNDLYVFSYGKTVVSEVMRDGISSPIGGTLATGSFVIFTPQERAPDEIFIYVDYEQGLTQKGYDYSLRPRVAQLRKEITDIGTELARKPFVAQIGTIENRIREARRILWALSEAIVEETDHIQRLSAEARSMFEPLPKEVYFSYLETKEVTRGNQSPLDRLEATLIGPSAIECRELGDEVGLLNRELDGLERDMRRIQDRNIVRVKASISIIVALVVLLVLLFMNIELAQSVWVSVLSGLVTSVVLNIGNLFR